MCTRIRLPLCHGCSRLLLIANACLRCFLSQTAVSLLGFSAFELGLLWSDKSRWKRRPHPASLILSVEAVDLSACPVPMRCAFTSCRWCGPDMAAFGSSRFFRLSSMRSVYHVLVQLRAVSECYLSSRLAEKEILKFCLRRLAETPALFTKRCSIG